MVTAPAQLDRPEVDEDSDVDRPWVTLVWDDPVNTMDYVTHVFRELFGFPRKKAEKLMLKVHQEGRCAVTTGTREQMEVDVIRLHARGLQASLQQD